MTKAVIEPLKIADAAAGLRHVFVRDLVLNCNIGDDPECHKIQEFI